MPGTCQCNGVTHLPDNKYTWKRKRPFVQQTLPIIHADHTVTTAPQMTEQTTKKLPCCKASYLLRAHRHNRTQRPLCYCCDKQQVICNGKLNNACVGLCHQCNYKKAKETRHDIRQRMVVPDNDG